MDPGLLLEMKQCIGLDDADGSRVRALAPLVQPLIPEVVDRFYKRLLSHPGAAAVFTGGAQQIRRLQGTLRTWLEEVIEGSYDQGYFDKRLRIGRTHVQVGLPQHFMVTGIELIWVELERELRRTPHPELDDQLRSLHRILMFELAVMLQSYQESHSEQVRTTERRAVNEQLTRAEHLAEIGKLAASLAHEIKNPLAGISGAIQIMRDEMPRDDPHRPILHEILGQIGRLDATVKDLLLYARPSPPRAASVPLGNVIGRVLSLLRGEPAMHHVRIHHDPFPVDAVAYADEAQLEQLLMNLVLNAAHASAEGGGIRLGLTRHAQFVRLTVTDRGAGMPPEVMGRAFEPFYTTKAKGTGLGLSICRRIVDAHGGTIELESEPGRGTRVVVDLPCDPGTPVHNPREPR